MAHSQSKLLSFYVKEAQKPTKSVHTVTGGKNSTQGQKQNRDKEGSCLCIKADTQHTEHRWRMW